VKGWVAPAGLAWGGAGGAHRRRARFPLVALARVEEGGVGDGHAHTHEARRGREEEDVRERDCCALCSPRAVRVGAGWMGPPLSSLAMRLRLAFAFSRSLLEDSINKSYI
jgi:hypothetical protein